MGEWVGVMAGYVWRLKQEKDKIEYQVYTSAYKSENTEETRSLQETSKLDGAKQFRSLKSTEHLKLPSELYESSKCVRVKDEPCTIKGVKIEVNQNKKTRLDFKACSSSFSRVQRVNQRIKLETNDSNVAPNSSNTWEESLPDLSKILYEYFQLEVDLDTLYNDWSERDSYFAKVACHFRGIRMLRQDPVENLLSFVCSSNNHISRISSMVEKLCTHYGKYITTVSVWFQAIL